MSLETLSSTSVPSSTCSLGAVWRCCGYGVVLGPHGTAQLLLVNVSIVTHWRVHCRRSYGSPSRRTAGELYIRLVNALFI